MKKILFILVILGFGAVAGWLGRSWIVPSENRDFSGEKKTEVRKALYYSCAMHPWIRSDKPGRCTICNMELTPEYGGANPVHSDTEALQLNSSQIQVLQVQTAEIKKRPLTRNLKVAGMIDDDATRHRVLAAYIDGRVDRLYVNYIGAEVTEGQPLAEFYSPNLLQAEREYRQLSGELRTNTALRLRQMGLAPAQIEALDQKPADALNSQILSPIGGTVVAQHVYEGQYVKEGDKLFEIADFSKMWFKFDAYEQDMPWIRLGQTVEVRTPSQSAQIFPGKITFIDPNFDETTRSTKIRVELDNPRVEGRRLFLHRLYADGRVKVETPEVLAVSRSAVVQTSGEAVVYVDQGGGSFLRKRVVLGRRGDEFVEVLDGVKEGEKVVTNGLLLMDGQAEMNRVFLAPVEPAASVQALVLSDAERGAMGDLVTLADALSSALSSDDLERFNQASEKVMQVTDVFIQAFKDRSELSQKMKTLGGVKHFHGFSSLSDARKAFHPYADAVSAALEFLHGAGGATEFMIWECGMADRAIPGAPKKARWVQGSKRRGENPFFGKAMPDCAVEIKQ